MLTEFIKRDTGFCGPWDFEDEVIPVPSQCESQVLGSLSYHMEETAPVWPNDPASTTAVTTAISVLILLSFDHHTEAKCGQ